MDRKIRLLIVDDNKSIHDDFRKILAVGPSNEALDDLEAKLFGGPSGPKAAAGAVYDITFCSQGEEAIAAVEKAEMENRPYALVFMDVRMPPGLDGIQTTKAIWAKYPKIQVVICSAYSDYSWIDVNKDLGNTDNLLFLNKPFEKVEVQQIVQALTRKWVLAREIENHVENLEKMVHERTHQLEIERARSTEASKFAALGIMSAGISHEINNPLAIIMLRVEELIDMARTGEIDKAALESSASKVLHTTRRIAKIVQSLRVFAQGGRKQFCLTESPVRTIFEDTLVLCQERFKAHSTKLEVPDVAADLTLDCDPVQISQIILNLLNNAFDAVQHLKEKWVRIGVEEKGDKLCISVTDSGSGIPQEVADKLMQPFFTTKEIGRGTGLGLSISKGIAEDHNGTLTLDRKCANTRFVLTLPRRGAAKKAA